MLFYEPLFLFVFFPTFIFCFLLGEGLTWLRGGIILAGSYLFYSWSDPLFPALVVISAAVDHVLARGIAGSALGSRRARLLLAIGVVLNLAVLIHFKYTNFIAQNLHDLLGLAGFHPPPQPNVPLPIGVSFVVFEKITYLVDVFRRISSPARSIGRYLLYVFFFPKLLAGPIIKFHEIEAQIATLPRANADDLSAGFQRFMLGVVKKVLLADTLAAGADAIFAPNLTPGFSEAWLGVVLFTFQIYFDFSAYSDMAIGLARMMGFRLFENFNMPYIACSMTEFWRRWHISLSTWIREYLYVPLGGNRVGSTRRYVNLWVCFLASGMWHGAAWTYLAWGAYNGLFLVLDKLFLLRVLDRLPRLAANAVAFLIVMVGWTVFRASSLAQAGAFLSAMTDPSQPQHTSDLLLTGDLRWALLASAVICVFPRLPGFERMRREVASGGAIAFAANLSIALLFVLAVGKAVADPFRPFLYFRF